MTSARRRCAVILSPVFFLLLPASSLCSAFCSRWLSCCVPVISDSSFFLSLLGGKAKETKRQREGGGVDALLYKLRFAQWGCRWSSLQKHYPPPCHSSLFILFIGLVVIITFVFVCNTCNTVWCERRTDNSYFLCFCSSNFSLSLSPTISNILSPFLVHCFPSRVCPFN